MADVLTRRDFLRYAACFAAQTAMPVGVRGATKGPSPSLNFVFILVDDLGWADVGCYGGDLHETPHIDRLARQGMRFTDAYAAAPVCSPTRASIMTGKYPARLHMTTWYEASANPPLGRRLVPPVMEGNMPLEQVTIADVDGLSLVPLLKNPSATLERQTLYWHYPHYYPTTSPVSSIRQGDWKLLEYFEDNRVELYNLKSDTGEEKDLAGKMPERAEELRMRLDTWRKAVNAQMPTRNSKSE
jgi:arylsulfatase A-like enzyme